MSFSTRVNATLGERDNLRKGRRLISILTRRKQLNPRSRALRVVVGVPPGEQQSSGRERAKIHLFKEWEGGGRSRSKRHDERTWEEERERERETKLPSLRLVLLSPSHHGVISCKALLSRCGNFIFATNLRPPLPRPLASSRRLVLSVLSLSAFSRARGPFLFSSHLLTLSEVRAKCAVSFTSFCPIPNYESCTVLSHQGCIALSWINRLILFKCSFLYSIVRY